jgi:hypothetical protein
MRRELGDQLTGITGQGIRAPGQIESDKWLNDS